MALTYVTAVITARDGSEAALEGELRKVIPLVRAEEGCVRYDLHRSEYANVFLFYEIWESPAHLAAHARAAHMTAMREATAGLVTGPAEVNIWEAADVVG